jgi:rubrerythrin
MPQFRNEAQRQRIVERLQKGESWRTIQREEKVSSTVVQDVAREAGLLRKRSTASAPSAPPPPADNAQERPQQGGNGLTEYLPERDEKRSEKAPPKSAPTGEKQACPFCAQEWVLEAGEKAPSACPHCHKLLDAQAAAADEIYQCEECGQQWQLDPGEAMPTACPNPDCGVAFQ